MDSHITPLFKSYTQFDIHTLPFCQVNAGEHICCVTGQSGWYVDNLGIVTSSGRVLGPVGGQGGGQRNCLESLPVGCDIRRTFLDRIKVI